MRTYYYANNKLYDRKPVVTDDDIYTFVHKQEYLDLWDALEDVKNDVEMLISAMSNAVDRSEIRDLLKNIEVYVNRFNPGDRE